MIAGRHRLEAVRRIKLETVPCIILEGDEREEGAAVRMEMAEIAENIHRRETLAIERNVLVAR